MWITNITVSAMFMFCKTVSSLLSHDTANDNKFLSLCNLEYLDRAVLSKAKLPNKFNMSGQVYQQQQHIIILANDDPKCRLCSSTGVYKIRAESWRSSLRHPGAYQKVGSGDHKTDSQSKSK
jgi:hypothetical protein